MHAYAAYLRVLNEGIDVVQECRVIAHQPREALQNDAKLQNNPQNTHNRMGKHVCGDDAECITQSGSRHSTLCVYSAKLDDIAWVEAHFMLKMHELRLDGAAVTVGQIAGL